MAIIILIILRAMAFSGLSSLRPIGLRADVAVVAHHAEALRERPHDRDDLLLSHVLGQHLEILRRADRRRPAAGGGGSAADTEARDGHGHDERHTRAR